ncbi:MAG: glycosyltransferase [Lachnospiraceae bacterium]|nr:glycosyltransferase [Lachnospiraceae bacterium]
MGKTEAKIVLIGPVYPYKGGISHYTGLLYRALCKTYHVTMVSYKFQYPKLLYKKEQRDYSNDSFKIDDTQYLLHTANPLNWLCTAKKINAMKPEMIIIQWWHPYFAPCYYMLCRCLRNTKILFVCHNVFPHERFPMDRILTKAVLRQGSCYIVQSKMDAEDLQTIMKHPVFRQTVHPTYNAFKLENISKEEARIRLGIHTSEKVLLFFGFVREYKGLKYLIQAMPLIIKRVADIKLLIVGDFSSEESKRQYEDMIAQTGSGDHIAIYDGYIPDKEVEKFFAACDIVVLPYISATQSGIAQIAYGFEKPVLATRVGGLPDVVINGETGYLIEPQNPEQIAGAVIDFYTMNRADTFADGIEREKYKYSWERMEHVINDFLDKETE